MGARRSEARAAWAIMLMVAIVACSDAAPADDANNGGDGSGGAGTGGVTSSASGGSSGSNASAHAGGSGGMHGASGTGGAMQAPLDASASDADASAGDAGDDVQDASMLPNAVGGFDGILWVGGRYFFANALDGTLVIWPSPWLVTDNQVALGLHYTAISYRDEIPKQLCGVTEAGPTRCFRESSSSTSSPEAGSPPADVRFVRVAQWGNDVCGLLTSGELACFGDEDIEPPPGRFKTLRGDSSGVCSVREDGEAVCWPSLPDSPAEMPPPGPFVDVAAGPQGNCGLHEDGSVQCWPRFDLAGASGVAELPGQWKLVEVGRSAARVGIDFCGLRPDGSIECHDVSFGAGTTYEIRDFDVAPPAGAFVAVRIDDFVTACAVTAGGKVDCWTLSSTSVEPSRPPDGLVVRTP